MWDIIGKAAIAFILVRFIWSCIKGLYGSFIASALGLNVNFKKQGQWAVITGATDGIGKAYAFEIAKHGLNIVLISRSPFKLQNVAAEITSQYKVETKIIDVDFTKLDIYERIQKELAGLDIGILVNNVGMSYDYPDFIVSISEKIMQNLINCNIMSVTEMCKIIIPGMQERKRGLIINISSFSSLIPAPFLAIYGATKAYMSNFSRSLQIEMKNQGIIIQCITPAFVVSNMSKLKKPSLMAPTPSAFVRSALKTAGIETSSGGYFMHKVQIYFTELAQNYLPGCFLEMLIYMQLKAMHQKAVTKKLKEEKSQ